MSEQGMTSRRGLLALGGAAGAAAVAGALSRTAEQAQAQTGPVAQKGTITLEAAMQLVTAAEAKARELGVQIAVAVVDEGGLLRAFGRMTGQNSAATTDIVQNKAYTAAAFRTPTHIFAERNAEPARLTSFANLPRVTLLGGGYPITRDGATIGGIGVGGGTPEQDQQIAEAALATLG